MTDTSQTQVLERPKSTPMLKAMVGIGIACGLLIVMTYEGTLPRIERLKKEALEQAIFRVLPGTVTTKTFLLSDAQKLEETTSDEGTLVYAGYDGSGDLLGIAIEGSGQGYADIIRILYGYNPNTEKIIGFYVLESKETPGLGDKIEKDESFLENFVALDVSLNGDLSTIQNEVVPVKAGAKENPWEVDGITGATISSRAIANIMNESIQYWGPLIVQQKEEFTAD